MFQRFFFSGLLAVLLACGSGGGTPTQPQATATLRGSVHVIPTGPPIAGVLIAIQNRSVTTAADGTFAVDNLAVGETVVVLSRDGYARAEIRLTLIAGTNTFSLGMSPN